VAAGCVDHRLELVEGRQHVGELTRIGRADMGKGAALAVLDPPEADLVGRN
jgi:hypothetical protein